MNSIKIVGKGVSRMLIIQNMRRKKAEYQSSTDRREQGNKCLPDQPKSFLHAIYWIPDFYIRQNQSAGEKHLLEM